MILFLEVIAVLVIIAFIVGVGVLAFVYVPRLIAAWRFHQSLEGRIARKERELSQEDQHIRDLDRELAAETSDYRRSLKESSREIAIQRRNQISLELEQLRNELATQEFTREIER